MSAKPILDRFMDKVVALDDEDGGCWVWLASRGGYGYGYGQFGIARSKSVLAHRWSYEHFVGPIPAEYVVDHLCRRPECVNPDHLEAITIRENVRRGQRDRIIYGSPWGERGERFEDYYGSAPSRGGIQSGRLAAPEKRSQRVIRAAEAGQTTGASYDHVTRGAS